MPRMPCAAIKLLETLRIHSVSGGDAACMTLTPFRSANSIHFFVRAMPGAMIQLSSSDQTILNQILELQHRHSLNAQDLVLLSLLGSHNYDQRLLMQLRELQHQSFANQFQIQHAILSPNAAFSSLLTTPSLYQPVLQLQQQPFQSGALDNAFVVPNQQSHASMVLSQLPAQEAHSNSVNGPPMDRELFNILFGAQSQSAAAETDPRPTASTLLAQPDDALMLSAYQVFLRQNIEVFQAASPEAITHVRGRNTPVYMHQVGIRCIHCKHVPLARRQKGSMYFPSDTLRIYQASQNMANIHMINGSCKDMPNLVRDQFQALKLTKSTSGRSGREYWAKCARDLGLVDTPFGIRFRCDLPAELAALRRPREI